MPQDIPARYEMGTPNMMAVAGLHAALSELKKDTIAHRQQIEQKNRERLLEILNEYDFVKLVGINDEGKYVGVVSFLIDGISSDSAAQIFKRLHIELRTGLQCAPLAHKFLGTYPAGTIRVSVGAYTQGEDFERLKEALDYIEENI
jgi:selenocysteine lyase/cysteine desulfurase